MPKVTCRKTDIEKCLARRVLCICNVILNHPLFHNIPREKTRLLSSISDVIKIRTGEHVFFRGAVIESIYFVLEGRTKTYAEDFDSSKMLIHKIQEVGDVLAIEALFTDLKYFPYSAQALEDSTILLLDRTKLEKYIQASPEVLLNLLRYLANQVIDLNERVQDLVLDDVSERLLKYLKLQASLEGSHKVELRISKTDLASILGTISSTLSRAFSQLEVEKLIKVNKTHIDLLKKY